METHNISMVSCQKGPTRHAYAWQIPFWQDTLDIRIERKLNKPCIYWYAIGTPIVSYVHSMSDLLSLEIRYSHKFNNTSIPLISKIFRHAMKCGVYLLLKLVSATFLKLNLKIWAASISSCKPGIWKKNRSKYECVKINDPLTHSPYGDIWPCMAYMAWYGRYWQERTGTRTLWIREWYMLYPSRTGLDPFNENMWISTSWYMYPKMTRCFCGISYDYWLPFKFDTCRVEIHS